MSRRTIDPEFKIESASLVLDQGYSIREACEAVGVGDTAMRRWVDQLRLERQGVTPSKGHALTPDQRKIQELEAKIRRIEREKEILKKATALLMSDSMKLSQ
jgi:transposase